MLQCFAAFPAKLYPEASHVGHAGQSRIAILYSGLGFSRHFATKMANEGDLVIVDEQPERKKKKKGTKEKRVWKDSKVGTLNRCPVQ